jgi:hypothetical protein
MDGKGQTAQDQTAPVSSRCHGYGRWRLILAGVLLVCLAFVRFLLSITRNPLGLLYDLKRHSYPGESIEWETCGRLRNGRPLEVSIPGVFAHLC